MIEKSYNNFLSHKKDQTGSTEMQFESNQLFNKFGLIVTGYRLWMPFVHSSQMS